MNMASSHADIQMLENHGAAPSSVKVLLAEHAPASPELRARHRDRFGRPELPATLLCFATQPSRLRGILEIPEHLLFVNWLLICQSREAIAAFRPRCKMLASIAPTAMDTTTSPTPSGNLLPVRPKLLVTTLRRGQE
jgi:hypothetical protein